MMKMKKLLCCDKYLLTAFINTLKKSYKPDFFFILIKKSLPPSLFPLFLRNVRYVHVANVKFANEFYENGIFNQQKAVYFRKEAANKHDVQF